MQNLIPCRMSLTLLSVEDTVLHVQLGTELSLAAALLAPTACATVL